jgi:peptide/nickel transport system permease protein
MWSYILRRLALLPITLFFIILVNFVVINLAPGDPVTLSTFGEGGDASKSANRDASFKDEDPYTIFREFYGLTLPILWNSWPWISYDELRANIQTLATHKEKPSDTEEMNFKDYTELKTLVGDQARFVMPLLLQVASSPDSSDAMRMFAVRAFVRGGTRPAFLGSNLSESEKAWNKKIVKDSIFLRDNRISLSDTPEAMQKKISNLSVWYEENKEFYQFAPTSWQKVNIFFTETRFCKYLSRVMTLNFGTLRNNDQQTVTDEVVKRLKYSLTLSLIPLVITFVLCQLFGLFMALKHSRWPDLSLNVLFLVLFAIPVFVVAPF